jgi:hypothetical protein
LVKSDRLFERYRLRHVLIAGAATVRPACTSVVGCCHDRHPSPSGVWRRQSAPHGQGERWRPGYYGLSCGSCAAWGAVTSDSRPPAAGRRQGADLRSRRSGAPARACARDQGRCPPGRACAVRRRARPRRVGGAFRRASSCSRTSRYGHGQPTNMIRRTGLSSCTAVRGSSRPQQPHITDSSVGVVRRCPGSLTAGPVPAAPPSGHRSARPRYGRPGRTAQREPLE